MISAVIAFTYCHVFYLAENAIGFDSTLVKQLAYWFIPNLVADIISINFTRWMLKKISKHPEKYLEYLVYDILMFVASFYICFSFTMIYLAMFSEYTIGRILLHPLYLFGSVIQNFPKPIGLDALFILLMSSTTFLPTLLHVIFTVFSLAIKFLIPFLRILIHNLIEKMISFERHPIGVAVITCGIFMLPLILTFELLI